jgi:hypothetical protein
VRALAVAVTAALIVAACASDTAETAEPAPPSGPTSTTVYDYPDASTRFLNRMMNEPRPVENSAMPPRHLDEELFPESLVDRTRIVWGGVAPDAIASIDAPRFERADTVDWIEDEEAVMVLQVDGGTRVYPVQVMIWHEIVNDRIGDLPVTVTYCPLCNSAVAFDRRVGGEVLDFGTSGSLHRSALVMYDRQTESLWTQFDGQAVIGTLMGEELEQLTVSTVSWSDVRADHPDASVLSRDTGYGRPYGTSRYGGIDSLDKPLSGWFTEEVDGRHAAFDRLVGIDVGGPPLAVMHALASAAGVVSAEVQGRPVTVWHQPGTASPINDREVAGGDEIGATGAFFSDADDGPGGLLTFTRADEGFVDDQTGSGWNILGEATSGPLTGTVLESIPHLDTFWFAWSTQHPDTTVLG